MATIRRMGSGIKDSGGGGKVRELRNEDPKQRKGGKRRKSVDGGDEARKRKKEDVVGWEMHVEIERSENRGTDEQSRSCDGDGGGDGERPKPVGCAIAKVGKLKLYSGFEYDGRRYQLEDTVLVTPEEENEKPSVGIIKEISEAHDGSISITVQWFYRPDDIEKVDKDRWISRDNRQLLMTNHKEEVPAQTLMHACVVHFLPNWKKLPDRKKHPGFVVLHFYDHLKHKVYKISDRDYMDSLQTEINQRIQETQSLVGHADTPSY